MLLLNFYNTKYGYLSDDTFFAVITIIIIIIVVDFNVNADADADADIDVDVDVDVDVDEVDAHTNRRDDDKHHRDPRDHVGRLQNSSG